MQNKIDEFWQWIELKRVTAGFSSMRQLEKASGHSVGAIGKRINNSQLPTTEMAMALCRTLKVSWAELWASAGMIPISDTTEIDSLFNELDEQGKKEAIAIIKALKQARG